MPAVDPKTTWMIARGTLNCQRCETLIIEGEWLKLVTVGQWPWCTACVKTVIHLEPPDDELKPATLSPAGVASTAHDLSRFKPTAVEGAQNFLPLLDRLKYKNHRHR